MKFPPDPEKLLDRPLTGSLVIDLSRALAGPHAAMMLGDLGARVIKVESATGDDSRGWGPPYAVPPIGPPESTYFLAANRNKESIVLDLKAGEELDVLIDLVRRADVLIENFRPGVMDRLGLGTSTLRRLNPRLVMLSITGFGHDGPEADRAGYDQIAQGEGGLMSLTGSGPEDPQRVGVPIADLLACIYGAFGVMAALLERESTSVGQVVRTSLLAAVVSSHALHGTAWTVAGEIGRAQGNHHPAIAPYGLFATADASVQIACGNDSLWGRLCDAFDMEDLRYEFSSNAERVANRERLTALLERRFSKFTSEAVLKRLTQAGVPAGQVRSIDDVYAWDQTLSQRLVASVDHTSLGVIKLPGPPLRFFTVTSHGETEKVPLAHRAPPTLDEDGQAVRHWLGRS